MRRGKLATPVPSVSPRDSGSLVQVVTGREGEGNHRAPISPQQPRKEESTREENGAWPLWPGPWRGTLGIRTVKLLAASPGMSVRHPGRGGKYTARDKTSAELSVLRWLPPQLVLSIILHSYMGCAVSPPRSPLACISPKLVLAPWTCEQMARMAGPCQPLLLG